MPRHAAAYPDVARAARLAVPRQPVADAASASASVSRPSLLCLLAGSGGFDDGATPARKYFPYDLVPKVRE
jgi:hypothetical protein